MDQEGNKKQRGFTLVELLIVLSIVAIMAALAMPSMKNALLKQQLKGAVDRYVGHLSFAHSDAMKTKAAVYVSVSPGQNWCYGLSDVSSCNCAVANQCLLQGVDTTFDNTDYANVSLSSSQFTVSNGNEYLVFEPIRATANHTGSLSFTAGQYSVVVSTTRSGVVNACSNQLDEYGPC